MKKKIYLLFYYSFIQHLPSSFFPFGNFYNYLRVKCIKGILPIGHNSKVQPQVYFGKGENVSIGNNCQINEKVKLDNVSIADYVMIAPGVTILGKMHEYKSLKQPMMLQGEKNVQMTIVEENVWIGTNAIIMPGIKISSGSIIAAGSVLTKDTEVNSIYGGVPAKFIKSRG